MTPEEIAAEICERTAVHRNSVAWFLILKAIEIARRDERERCAKIAEDYFYQYEGAEIAANIRKGEQA
jgi:hypothetical protein